MREEKECEKRRIVNREERVERGASREGVRVEN